MIDARCNANHIGRCYKNLYFALLLSVVFALPGFAQDATDVTTPAANPTTMILLARTGQRIDEPHVGTYHFLELLQLRGKWILPDVGYIDFATANYHELFVGIGRTLYDSKKLTMIEELYFDQAFGPAAKGARYAQIWTMVQVHFAKKFSNETVYFPYLPLNSSARIQHVLERSKFEYALNRTWKVGAGYAGYKFGDNQWQNRPMVTTTLSTRTGAYEFWFQKMPGGGQVQVRYTLVHVHKN